ncbi:lipopolysaccharide assembly protein LapA domain-containing protein [Streptomyces sp. NPDC048416]|uniref:lipopolysaccharide assembly protein LapA domain-containing protein n=1 Tax=Streptomyces sp. NPDC048416 TaxID=3365546 RepID=UPI003715619D
MSPTGETSGTRRRTGGAVTPGRIAVLVLGILALVFIFENTRHVTIRLLVPEVSMPLYLALLAVFVVGLCCGYFLKRRGR